MDEVKDGPLRKRERFLMFLYFKIYLPIEACDELVQTINKTGDKRSI